MDSFYKSNKNYSRVLEQIDKSRRISEPNKRLISFFVQRLQAENISASRIKKYVSILRNIATAVPKDFRSYKTADLQRFLAQVNSKGFSVWTVNDYKMAIKRFFRFVEGEGYNPLKYRWIKISKKGPGKFAITYSDLLNPAEIETLVGVARSPMYKCLISLAYETGARPSELLSLTVGSLTPVEGYTKVSLQESKTFIRTVYSLESDRYLRAWLNLHPLRQDRDAPLFPSSYIDIRRKDFLTPSTYNIMLKRFAKMAGFQKRVYSYLLRHTRITHLLELGWNEVMIKKLVGHSLDSAAFKVYEHLAERQLEQYVLSQRQGEKDHRKSLGLPVAKTCTFCKTENEPTVDFCAECGRAISIKGLVESGEKERELLRFLTPEMIEEMIERKVQERLKSLTS